jgi:hypothetical protein
LLRSKGATDVLGDDSHIVFADAELLRKLLAQREYPLGGRLQGKALAFPPRGATVRL